MSEARPESSRPRRRSRDPEPADIETAVEVLAEGLPLVDSSVVGGARALARCMSSLSDSLKNPYILRQPSDGSDVLDGIHDVLLSAAEAIDAVSRWIVHAGGRGDLGTEWREAKGNLLDEARQRLETVLPLVGESARLIGELDYTGADHGNFVLQARSLVDELIRLGAMVFYESAVFDREQDDNQTGWRIYFQVTEDTRLFTITGEPTAGLDGLPAFLTYHNVHPALIATYALENLDQFAVDRTTFPGDLFGFPDT